ncbi:MAG TPA: hypothetical protein VHH15_17255, partial [Actinophytocola sp.]|nr:hypothetical protein [Actinophytocola sp.]
MSYGHQQGAPRRPEHGRAPGYGRPPGQRRPAYHETRALPIPPTDQPRRPGPPRDRYDQGYG